MTLDLNPKFTFETLVQCDFNQLAAAAGKTVVRSPGTSYNPLFIVGGPGLGKTHLLMAIGNHAQSGDQGLSVEYVSLSAFAESYRASVAAGEIEAFRNRFADVDIILFDDVQLVEGQKEIQRELAHVVRQLRGLDRQVVLACDKQPSAIAGAEPDLLEAITAGLSVDISPPGRSERAAIIAARLESGGAQLADEAIEVVADPGLGDLREMFNLLRRLMAFQAVSKEPIDARIALDVIRGRLSAPFRSGTMPAVDPGSPPSGSEFSHFFDGVASTLTTQIDSWGDKLQTAIRKWRQVGFDVEILEEAARVGESSTFSDVIAEYEAAVQELRRLAAKAAELTGTEIEESTFRNPGDLDDARLTVAEIELYGSLDLPAPTPGWTINNFVVGLANREALEAGMTALERPENVTNPLVIQGPVGVGKSHLLHALANHAIESSPRTSCCLSTHDLIQESQREGAAGRDVWLHRYGRVTAIFLDDFQLALGQEGDTVVAEMLSRAVESGTQVVLTLSSPVDQLAGMPEDLAAFLGGGHAVAVDHPDRELKRDLVKAHLSRQGLEPASDLLDYLADRHVSSLREVQAQVQRVVDATIREQRELSPAIAREVLEGSRPGRRRSSVGVRASGVMLAPGVGIRSTEKTVWIWPELSHRMIEELG